MVCGVGEEQDSRAETCKALSLLGSCSRFGGISISDRAKFGRVGYSAWDEVSWNDLESLSKSLRVCLV